MMNMYGNQDRAIAGLKYGIDDANTESLAAGEDMYPGDPVFGMQGDDKVGYKAHINAVKLTASADLVASNSIAVTVNGVVLPAIVFSDSSAATIKTIVDAIDQNEDIRALGIDAFYDDANPRVINLQAGGSVTITASATVTGGASQATFASTANTNMAFMGITRFEQVAYGNKVGCFPAGTSVPVQTAGKVWVPVTSDSTPGDKTPAYVILTGDDAGKFTDSAADNFDTGCFFRSNKDTNNLALIEVRGMKLAQSE